MIRIIGSCFLALLASTELLTVIAAFAAATAAFQAEEWVSEKPAVPDEGFVWAAFGYYAWHLLDAIPLLDVPKTLNWKAPTSLTDHFGGAILLFFKLVVIIPIVRFVLGLVKIWQKPTEETSRP